MDIIKAIQNKQADFKIHYKTVDGLNLPMDFYYPQNNDKSILKPAIVCIHGGAWSGRVDNSHWNGDYMNVIARYYAMYNVIGVNISYRNIFNPIDKKTEFENEYEIFDLYKDCLDALWFVMNNAHQYGIDKNKVAVIGDSAGGHLALCVGTLDIFRNEDDVKPYAVIACNPITDLNDEKWYKYIQQNSKQCEFANTSKNERARILSPLHNISKNTVHTLLIHGTSDSVVNIEHTLNFYNKSKQINSCEMHSLIGADHAFILPEYYKDRNITLNALNVIDKYLRKYEIVSNECEEII